MGEISTTVRRSITSRSSAFYNSNKSSNSSSKNKKKKKKKKHEETKRDEKHNKKREALPLLTIGASTIKHSSTSSEENNNNTKKIQWNTIPSSMFQVRSHDYLPSKIKIPSPESLYDLYNVDIYESDKRIPNISSRIQLPDNNTSNCWNYCPDMLIFYLSLPTEAPSLGFSHNVDDGLGILLICYFKLKDSTKEIFQNLQNENKKHELESSSLDNNNDNIH